MDPTANDMLAGACGLSALCVLIHIDLSYPDCATRDARNADYHGLPLDNATVPASTEARTRQYEDIHSLLPSNSSPPDPFDSPPFASQTSAQPDMNQGLASGSVTPESSREAAPDVLRRVPLDTSADATREYTVLTSRNPPAEAPMDPTLLHDNGCCRVHPDQVSVAGGTPEPPRLAATDATLQNLIDKLDATRDTVILPSLQPPEEAPMEPRRSHDPGYCRALPDYTSGYGAMPEAAPSSGPQHATALPNSTQPLFGPRVSAVRRPFPPCFIFFIYRCLSPLSLKLLLVPPCSRVFPYAVTCTVWAPAVSV